MSNTKEDTRYFNQISKMKIKCNCGHSVAIPVYIDKKLCSWCGHYIYRNKKEQFIKNLEKCIKGCC